MCPDCEKWRLGMRLVLDALGTVFEILDQDPRDIAEARDLARKVMVAKTLLEEQLTAESMAGIKPRAEA